MFYISFSFIPDHFRYKVMCRCWEELPTVRPNFSLLKIQINEVLEHLQNQNLAYLTVEYERVIEKSAYTITGWNDRSNNTKMG